MPRTLTRAQTALRGPGGLPACHGAESTRKDPWSEEKKRPKGPKNTCIYAKRPHHQTKGRRNSPWMKGRKIQINAVAGSNATTGHTCQKHSKCQQRWTEDEILHIISREMPEPTIQYFCGINDGPPNDISESKHPPLILRPKSMTYGGKHGKYGLTRSQFR